MNSKTFIKSTICIVALGFLIALTSCNDTTGPNKETDTTIISFNFMSLNPDVIGTINNTAKTIALKVPPMTDKSDLVPTIVVADGATINPASGVKQNFNNPVQYTVTAKDGTTKAVYTVTVTEDNTSIQPVVLSGTFTDNKTLPNIRDGVDYIIETRVYIKGSSLLTVEPGVTIEFTTVNSALSIEDNAGISMIGTAEKPIIFKNAAGNPNSGAWAGIMLWSGRADNVWKYVQIINGGKKADGYAAVDLRPAAELSMENCLISGAGDYGIYMEGKSKFNKFENNEIRDCEDAPIYCNDIVQLTPFNKSSKLVGNGKDYIDLNINTYVKEELTISEVEVPYKVKNIYLQGGTLNINPGVQLLFQYDGRLNIDALSIMNAVGTAEKPITFTTQSKVAGQWRGIEIQSKQNNTLTYCNVSYGGSQDDRANLYIWNGKVILNNVKFENSSTYGVIYNKNSTITHSNVTFANCALGNVYLYDTKVVTETLP